MGRDKILLQATSAGIAPDGSTYVTLQWETMDGVTGFNLYRRAAGKPQADPQPVNGGKPIVMAASAEKFRAYVAEGSPAWEALARGFTAAAGKKISRHLVDPAAVFQRGLTNTERTIVFSAAQGSLTLSQVAGLAFTDHNVEAGEQYVYELHAVTAGKEIGKVTSDVPVQAGLFVPPQPPSGVTTESGDRRVLVLWNRNPHAAAYVVQRRALDGGKFLRVSPNPIVHDLNANVNGLPLTTPRPGFLDICVWNSNGFPISHLVQGSNISGPNNGITYAYQVASLDAHGNMGPWSLSVEGKPQHTVPPKAPDSLQVSPNTAGTGLVITWRKVTRNVENHWFPDTTQINFVYRAETQQDLESLDNLPFLVATLADVNPQDQATPFVSWTDLSPELVPEYGTKTFYYRVRVMDAFQINGAPSAIIAGAVSDTKAPGPTTLVDVIGAADHIRVEWEANEEPDLAGYQVYRGVCNNGKILRVAGGRVLCDMTLIGDVSLGEAKELSANDAKSHIWFEDHTVPGGSPLCYGYWVRAYDQAGNLYSTDTGCPNDREYCCGHLIEKTPPPVPVITSLRALNGTVRMEWISSPTQDLRAFHVYRSDAEDGQVKFLACVFTDHSVSPEQWEGMTPSCKDVPAVLNPLTCRGTYVDGTVEPHRVYWYRVSALDWLGNESSGSELQKIPSSSTFTYTSDLPAIPSIFTPSLKSSSGCGLQVAWTPAFNPDRMQGFVVFRATLGGDYRQVSGILKDSTFVDPAARRNLDYLYRVQSLDITGLLSEASEPVLHRY